MATTSAITATAPTPEPTPAHNPAVVGIIEARVLKPNDRYADIEASGLRIHSGVLEAANVKYIRLLAYGQQALYQFVDILYGQNLAPVRISLIAEAAETHNQAMTDILVAEIKIHGLRVKHAADIARLKDSLSKFSPVNLVRAIIDAVIHDNAHGRDAYLAVRLVSTVRRRRHGRQSCIGGRSTTADC